MKLLYLNCYLIGKITAYHNSYVFVRHEITSIKTVLRVTFDSATKADALFCIMGFSYKTVTKIRSKWAAIKQMDTISFLARWHSIFPPKKLKKINRWFRGRLSVQEPTIRSFALRAILNTNAF